MRTPGHEVQVAHALNRKLSVIRRKVFTYWQALGGGWYRLITQDNEVLGNLKTIAGSLGYSYDATRLPERDTKHFLSAYQAAAYVERRES